MLLEISRIMIAGGAVAAGLGFVFFGIGLSFVEPEPLETNAGIVLMVGGILAVVVGSVIYRNQDGNDAAT